jgi:hypothetical protein
MDLLLDQPLKTCTTAHVKRSPYQCMDDVAAASNVDEGAMTAEQEGDIISRSF